MTMDNKERAATKFTIVGECYISTYSTASHGYPILRMHDGRTVETGHSAGALRVILTMSSSTGAGNGCVVNALCNVSATTGLANEQRE